jgi:diguanylate cyclase (GGDEF)-like protein
MAASLIISTATPGRGHWIVAGVTATVLLAVAGLVLPFATMPLPERAGFLPGFIGMMFLADLVTATLLFSQADAAQDRSTADLAAAYLFSVVIVVPHLMAFPGVFADKSLLGTSASAVWLWCAWHAGFALCVARYACRRQTAGAGPIRIVPVLAALAAAVLAAIMVATAGVPYLPEVLHGGGFGALITSGVGPAVLACNVVALGLVVISLRGRTVVDLWLAVAMLAATLDVILTLCSGGRYTLGWYGARMLSLVTGITVLVALLAELAILFSSISGLNERLQLLSVTDGLTQLANRRGFDEALDRAWRTAEREETPISLLMIDIDHFKGFNDTYGHPAGDECLRRVAALISSHARRPYDIAGRLGGEEFGLLMPATDEAGAALIAHRLRAGIENLLIPHQATGIGHVTISGGVATFRPFARREVPAMLIDAADHALYEAKTSGRNSIHAAIGAVDLAASLPASGLSAAAPPAAGPGLPQAVAT